MTKNKVYGLLDQLFPMNYHNLARPVEMNIRQKLALVGGKCNGPDRSVTK